MKYRGIERDRESDGEKRDWGKREGEREEWEEREGEIER